MPYIELKQPPCLLVLCFSHLRPHSWHFWCHTIVRAHIKFFIWSIPQTFQGALCCETVSCWVYKDFFLSQATLPTFLVSLCYHLVLTWPVLCYPQMSVAVFYITSIWLASGGKKRLEIRQFREVSSLTVTFPYILVQTVLNSCVLLILYSRISVCLSFDHNIMYYRMPHGSSPMIHTCNYLYQQKLKISPKGEIRFAQQGLLSKIGSSIETTGEFK